MPLDHAQAKREQFKRVYAALVKLVPALVMDDADLDLVTFRTSAGVLATMEHLTGEELFPDGRYCALKFTVYDLAHVEAMKQVARDYVKICGCKVKLVKGKL